MQEFLIVMLEARGFSHVRFTTVLEPPIQKYLSVEEDSPERYAIESK